MMAVQRYGINHYKKGNFADSCLPALLKSRQAGLDDKMGIYFNHHPLVFLAVSLVGIPIGILLAVGLAAALFGLITLGVMSLL